MQLLTQRAKLGVAGALALASMAGGTGLANAAPGHVTQPQSGTASYLGGHAPDGTRITALSAIPGHSWADGVAPAVAEGQAPDAVSIPVKVTGGITLARDQHGPRPGNNTPPPAAGPKGQMSTMAGYQWFPGRSTGATGVRIRATVPSGTVRGHLAPYSHLWIWCEQPAGGTWWNWIAYYTGGRWIYGYVNFNYVYLSPDRSLPRC
ncbi:hypothetical protein ACFORH_39160 [Amycolatopsis roodepoortensis]|uniref:SH3 domain-containing protein n=1 Tax=Amycolatopsis roodepoortensis TaxID=700274 RepID=A0ABR9LIL8_9PSEU|nr:hypothetical protein [Amycolatopsis roodepoortensis]MBE1580536.1 hypothetical protein [Amycolatopsis roodepoortensis]